MPAEATLHATVDRIITGEDGKELATLILDDGQQLVVDSSVLPVGIREKQLVEVSFRVDSEETARRTGEVERLQGELFGSAN